MNEEGVEVAPPASFHGESHKKREPQLDLVGEGNVVFKKENHCASSRNWWKIAFVFFAVATIALAVTLGKVKSNEPSAVSQSNQSGLVCEGDSRRQTEDGVLRLTLGNMNTTLNEEQTLFLASTIKESYNSEAGCGELYQRYLEDVKVTNQEVLRTKSGVSHLETEIRTKVSFQCFGTNCPSAEEPMFSVTPSNERKLGDGMDKFRGVKRELNAQPVNANKVIEDIEQGLRRDPSMNSIYVDEAGYGTFDTSRVDFRKKGSSKADKSGKKPSKSGKKSGKYGEYFDAECANYTETYTITLEVILTNDTDTDCYESIPDAFAGAHNIVATASDNCEDGQRTWDAVALNGVTSNTEVPFIVLDSRRRRNLMEKDEELQGNRRLKADRDSTGTISITVSGNCNRCVRSTLDSDRSNRMMEELDRYLQTSETECCEPPSLDALLDQFNSDFEGDCIEEVTDIVSVSIVDEGTYRACSNCIPDGFFTDDYSSCPALESAGTKCCNTCRDNFGDGAECVSCLDIFQMNFAYNNCADFIESGQTCCEGFYCQSGEVGVSCVGGSER